MEEIKTLSFNENFFNHIREYHFGTNWPVVYLLENGKQVYVGESTNMYNRSKQHFSSPEKKILKNLHIISDHEYNKSASLDIESQLIEYMAADGTFKVTNKSAGMPHEYYDRERYRAKFETIWRKLRELSLATKDIQEIKNSDLFKYSPYKSLTSEQFEIVQDILDFDKTYTAYTMKVEGKPGTGKTILAVYLVKRLIDKKIVSADKIGFVVPMKSLRKTLKNVFRNVNGLSPSMVIGPNDVVKKDYEILIADEAHRLQRRKGIMNYRAFDVINKKFGFDQDGSQLDWILESARKVILFYDGGQSVKPADVRPENFHSIEFAKTYTLVSQMRVAGGEDYIKFVEDLFSNSLSGEYFVSGYELKIFENMKDMVSLLKTREAEYTLARLVSGYAWPWKSRLNPDLYDIEIDGVKLKWNSKDENWVHSENSTNEVGCIHTIQGYDLNYAAVIIGHELSYDPREREFIINEKNYYDKKGRYGINDPEELKRYIMNIYRVLLTRGIKGTYVYIVDDSLRKYFMDSVDKFLVV